MINCANCLGSGCGACTGSQSIQAQQAVTSGSTWINPYAQNITGTPVYYTSPPPVAKPSDKNIERKQLKVFIHFATKFVERNHSWILTPDSSRPFERVILENPNKMLRIYDRFPMSELEITGLTTQQFDKLYPTEMSMPRLHLIPYSDFQYWSLGVEELPDLLL